MTRKEGIVSKPNPNPNHGKTGPQRLKRLPCVSSHMKDNVEVIHFNIRSKGEQGLVFVQKTFENSSTKEKYLEIEYPFKQNKIMLKT